MKYQRWLLTLMMLLGACRTVRPAASAPRRITLLFMASPDEAASTRRPEPYKDALYVDGYVECIHLTRKDEPKTHSHVLSQRDQIKGGKVEIEWPEACQDAQAVDIKVDVMVNFTRCSSLMLRRDFVQVRPAQTVTVSLTCDPVVP